jgi:predicted CopG family antitoxin
MLIKITGEKWKESQSFSEVMIVLILNALITLIDVFREIAAHMEYMG